MSAGRVQLSVNVNKVATLRNSRGGSVPSVIDAVRVCVATGVPGITVHPRADARHITMADVREIASELATAKKGTEFNIEGDPRSDLLAIVREVRPTQCTLVPVKPGEVTSQAGWPANTPLDEMRGVVRDLQKHGSRVSMFVDPEPAPIHWAASLGADRIELYTEPFARAFATSLDDGRKSFQQYAEASQLARELGLGVNAGHDLDLENLTLFRSLPHLDEVSIGHALISHALFVGLERSLREYLAALAS
jgi:pyridoxine 5-phosphate synthase